VGKAWTPAEDEKLGDLLGDFPWGLVIQHYKRWARAEGYPERTEGALRFRAGKHGSMVCTGQWVRLATVRDAIGVKCTCTARWIRKGLIPVHLEGTRSRRTAYVNREALKTFAKRYPHYFEGQDRRTLALLFDPNSPLVEQFSGLPKAILSGQHKPVRCVETGHIYPSVRAAAKAVHVTDSAIRRAINKRGTAADRHFTYIEADALKQHQQQQRTKSHD